MPGKPRTIRPSTRTRTALLILALALVPAGRTLSAASEADRLVELLDLAPGKVVADVGAGDGRWTAALSRAVGSDGHVFATEVEAKLVTDLETEMAARGLQNVTAVLGTNSDAGLDADCCDAILLRMVYHHFRSPDAMRASLHRAMRSDGLLAVVDIEPQTSWRRLPDVPERGGHGIDPETLIRELEADGFELVSLSDEWDGDEDRYCALFRRARSPESAESAETQ